MIGFNKKEGLLIHMCRNVAGWGLVAMRGDAGWVGLGCALGCVFAKVETMCRLFCSFLFGCVCLIEFLLGLRRCAMW